MKNLIIIALLMTGMASFAQEKPMATREKMEKLTPEQRNELRLKKMTLDLGLNASQQKDMAKIISEQSAKMEAAKAERKSKAEKNQKLTADERFALQSKMLDEKIATKEKVKKILTPEQFEKWEKMSGRKHAKMREHGSKRRSMPEEKK